MTTVADEVVFRRPAPPLSGSDVKEAEPSAPLRDPVAPPRLQKLQPRRTHRPIGLRHLLPAWSVSLLVHVVILLLLAAATFTGKDSIKGAVNFDSALAGYRLGEREETPILADPANIPREQAIGEEHGGAAAPVVEVAGEGGDDGDGGGAIVAGTFGGAGPSATPRISGAGKRGVNEGNSLPDFKTGGMSNSPINTLPEAPDADLFGGGRIAGDPLFEVSEIGAALDQLAREILRHLKDHKLTVVWLFDESSSMVDDQRTILEKFDRVSAS